MTEAEARREGMVVLLYFSQLAEVLREANLRLSVWSAEAREAVGTEIAGGDELHVSLIRAMDLCERVGLQLRRSALDRARRERADAAARPLAVKVVEQ